MRQGRTRAATTTVLALATLALAGPGGVAQAAAPETVDEGLWYYSSTGVAEAHQRTTGEGITIAILDTPINPAAPDLVGADLQVRPSLCAPLPGAPTNEVSTGLDAEHATAMAAMLIGTGAGANGQRGVQGVAPGVTLLHYSITPLGWTEASAELPECAFPGPNAVADSIDQAVADGADIISLSVGGIWLPDDGRAAARAYAAGVVVVGGAANEGGPLSGPGDLNGAVAVEMVDAAGNLDEDTTQSEFLTVVAPGADIRVPTPGPDGSWGHYRLARGTSLATPWVAGVLALGWSLHPEATANQMMQSLIRNTASEGPDLAHDEEWGYGAVSVAQFLDADPTQYPDENPLVRPPGGDLDVPTTEEILAAYADAAPSEPAEPTEPSAEPSTDPTPEAAPDADADDDAAPDEGDGASPLLPILGVAAALLVVAAVIAFALRRRSQHPSAR